MPARWIREGIISSDRIKSLDWAAEVFYRRLLNKVDDHGLYDARPSFLRSSLYPVQIDQVSEEDCSRWLSECERAGLILRYEAAGKPYLKALDTRWKKRSEPKYPLPDDGNCKQLKTSENNCEPITSVVLRQSSNVIRNTSVEGRPEGRPVENSKETRLTGPEADKVNDTLRRLEVDIQADPSSVLTRFIAGFGVDRPGPELLAEDFRHVVQKIIAAKRDKTGRPIKNREAYALAAVDTYHRERGAKT